MIPIAQEELFVLTKRTISHDHACCSEHCDDYIQLLQELIEAEKIIEELQQHVTMLEDLLDERDG